MGWEMTSDELKLFKSACSIYEAEIDELKKQIEKMKNFNNCTHEVDTNGCDRAGADMGDCPCDKWEMAE